MATLTNVDVILDELGWGDGFRIPVANEENKKLEEEIARKMQYKASLNAKLESVQERLQMIRKHSQSVSVQQNVNQKLLAAHAAQLDAEDHHYKLSNNIESSLRQEARRFEKEWEDVNERISAAEKELARITKRLEESKRAVKFNEDSLLEWEEALNRKEEDNRLIEHYMKQDAKKYKELELKRQKLSTELESHRKAIIRVIDEINELEIVLDRTAKLYSQGLKERQQMLNQWTQSVAMLRQRDADIQRISREIETLREIKNDKMNVLREAEQFFKDQVTNNKQVEEAIKISEKRLFEMKEEHRKLTDAIGMYTIEISTQKKNVEDLARRTQQIRGDVKRKKIEIENKCIKIEDLKKKIEKLNKALGDINNQKLNIEDKTKQLEKMIEEEEKHKGSIIKEINRLQAAILRTGTQITELECEKKILEMQRQNERKRTGLLEKLQEKEKKLLEEKKEILYQLEFQIQKSEMKLERLRGTERNRTEAEKKLKRIEELQNVLLEKTETAKLLQNQITNVEHDMKKISNSIASDNTELERLRNKRQDLVLLLDGGEKRLKAAQTRNEDKQVEENILYLRVSQLEQLLHDVDDKVYNLEKYRLQLEAALKERKTEITVQKESLTVQKRIIASECSELRCAISERKNRIQQLKTRYDNTVATFGCSSDGTPLTTAHLKIQNAQEKYLLQEQGDKLDETIQKTEQEIQSMENTLRIINACNDKYKMNLNPVDKDAPEHVEQKNLDEELHNAQEKLRQKQITLQRLNEDIQKMEDEYDALLTKIEDAKEEKNNKEQHLKSLERQIAEQREKMSRADKTLRKIQKELQNKYATTGDNIILLQEKEIALRELQEQNALALQDIAEFTIRHVEAEVYIKKLLAAKNIELPSLPQSSPSAKSSQRSSVPSLESPENTNRTNVVVSSRESIGSIVNIEPQFNPAVSTSSSKKSKKYEETSKKSTKTKQPSVTRRNY